MDKQHDRTIQLVKPVADRRFFTVPTLGDTAAELHFKAHLIQSEDRKRHKEEGRLLMRYAAYVRVSHEEQVTGYSLDAQRRAIREWVAGKGGTVVKIYADEGESALTAARTSFQKMRLDARHGKFDALIVHKFDRFARNRTDSLAIKSLLRYDYGI